MEIFTTSETYQDPEKRKLEIVERKGIGHPDTLADALADVLSTAYSNHCLRRFGAIPHHNLDKLYIGAGLSRLDYGVCEIIKPVQVRINGRLSNSFSTEKIDLETICESAIMPYLLSVLPHLQASHIRLVINATQHTKVPHWFTPRSIADLPEYQNLRANDTAVCVSHWPLTATENLVLNLEKHFWFTLNGAPVPKQNHLGQDIKVMACRNGNHIDVTVCLPTISTHTASFEQYVQYIRSAEKELNEVAGETVASHNHLVRVRVNPYQRQYLLGIGSCIECGEEGIVGRGNSNTGVISVFRSRSVEAWAGKNPVYHTGRVYGFLTLRLAQILHERLGVKCTVTVVTKNGHSLLSPYLLSLETDKRIDGNEARSIIESELNNGLYLRQILDGREENELAN